MLFGFLGQISEKCRSSSRVLVTAEHFLAAVASLLQVQEYNYLKEVNNFSLQINQTIGTSQFL